MKKHAILQWHAMTSETGHAIGSTDALLNSGTITNCHLCTPNCQTQSLNCSMYVSEACGYL